MKVDFPALGRPSNPTSASTFSSSLSVRCSPGSPGVAFRGVRLVLDLKLTLPSPPLPPRASNAACSCAARSATVSPVCASVITVPTGMRSEEHTSELQSLAYLVCRLLLEKKKKQEVNITLVT